MTFSNLPTDARLYIQPVRFVDSPIGLADGAAARIGPGLIWFSAYEVTARRNGERIARETIALSDWADMLAALPDPLKARAETLAANISQPRAPWTLGDRTLRFDAPLVMGILNLTPDSFSDGGRFLGDPGAAAEAGFLMHEAGAAVIDVGGESTRPKADKVWEGDEIKRVVPVIERLAAGGVPVSIDTRKAAVMEAALGAGARIVNDVSALQHDPRSLEVAARAGCPVILMHAPSSGADPHENRAGYGDVVTDVFDFLEARIAACVDAGIDTARIMVDPGIGFGKSLTDNLALTNRLAALQSLGLPLSYGASRKRMVGALSNEAPVEKRLGGSIALAFRAAELGAQMIRVHDAAESVQALHVWCGLRDGALASA